MPSLLPEVGKYMSPVYLERCHFLSWNEVIWTLFGP